MPELSCALLISGYDYLAALPSFQEGDFQVQDISSMLVAQRADPKEGDYVIDVCAAPGGKALHLADMLAGTGMVEARDISDYKGGAHMGQHPPVRHGKYPGRPLGCHGS